MNHRFKVGDEVIVTEAINSRPDYPYKLGYVFVIAEINGDRL